MTMNKALYHVQSMLTEHSRGRSRRSSGGERPVEQVFGHEEQEQSDEQDGTVVEQLTPETTLISSDEDIVPSSTLSISHKFTRKLKSVISHVMHEKSCFQHMDLTP